MPLFQSLRSSVTDSTTGFALCQVLSTHDKNAITSLRLHPSEALLVASNDFGTLSFFDLNLQANQLFQSRQLLAEQGGISELCWVTDNILAVGTTRGKIITFGRKNQTGRFYYADDVTGHGDGVSEVAVESMDVSADGLFLVSVGQERSGIKLWTVDSDGKLGVSPIEEQSPEFAVPRFVRFANDGSEIVVGYLDPALIKTYSLQPWRLLQRRVLSPCADWDGISCSGKSRPDHYLGSAILLRRTNQLAVFNLQDGVDIYSSSDLTLQHTVHFNVNPRTIQGIALLGSGKLLASPTKEGNIKIFRNDATAITVLRCPGAAKTLIPAIDACTLSNRGEEYLVAASGENTGGTVICVWRRMASSFFMLVIDPAAGVSYVPLNGNVAPKTVLTQSDALRNIFFGVVAYYLCSLIQPIVAQLIGSQWVEVTLALIWESVAQLSHH